MSGGIDLLLAARLPALPLAEWEPTKDTLHFWAQIVGKVRLGVDAAILETPYGCPQLRPFPDD